MSERLRGEWLEVLHRARGSTNAGPQKSAQDRLHIRGLALQSSGHSSGAAALPCLQREEASKTVAKGFAALPPTRLRLLRRKYSWVTTDFMIRILADVREALQPWLRMVKPILVLDTASPYLQHTVTMLVRQHCWQPIVEGRNISQQSVADNQYFWYCCILLLRQRCWLPILKHFCKWELPKALRKISVVKILQMKLSWAPRQLWQDVACASW